MVGLDNPLHILMLLVVVLLVFGAKRLPEMGTSLGQGLRSFKNSLSGEPTVSAVTADREPERPQQLPQSFAGPAPVAPANEQQPSGASVG